MTDLWSTGGMTNPEMTSNGPVTITVPARNRDHGADRLFDQLLHDIFTTCMEGGLAGWAESIEYRWSKEGTGDESDTLNFRATFRDEDDNVHTITRDVMVLGWLRAIEVHHRIRWSNVRGNPAAIEIIEDWNDSDFDAGDAANIVQLGVGLRTEDGTPVFG